MVGRGVCVCEGFSFTTFVPTIRKNEKKKNRKKYKHEKSTPTQIIFNNRY
jgi:hypothetical protein